jgi:hypothetical protein
MSIAEGERASFEVLGKGTVLAKLPGRKEG